MTLQHAWARMAREEGHRKGFPNNDMGGTAAVTRHDATILAYLRQHPGAEVGEIRDAIGMAGQRNRKATSILSRMEREGAVRSEKRLAGDRTYRQYFAMGEI